jgi:regulator of replication initiation timing
VKKRRDLESKVEETTEEVTRLERELGELKAATAIIEAEKQHLADRLEAVPPFEEKGPACCNVQ